MADGNSVQTISIKVGVQVNGVPDLSKKSQNLISTALPVFSLNSTTSPLPVDLELKLTTLGIESSGKTTSTFYPNIFDDRVFSLESTRTTGTSTTTNFVDITGINTTIDLVGQVTQGSKSPYDQNLSALFDGVDDYVVVSNSSELAFSTSSFTIEGWIKPTNSNFFILKSSEEFGFSLGYNIDNNDQGLVLGIKDSTSTSVTVDPASLMPTYATGGDLSDTYTSGGLYKYHVFNQSGTLSVAEDVEVEFLIVAGGGGGGEVHSGAGGAGGYISSVVGELSGRSTSPVSKASLVGGTDYTIVVGAGGAKGSGRGTNGYNGGDSSAFGITALGGGGGGSEYKVGVAGGSGGGGASFTTVRAAGTAGQGYDGGLGTAGGDHGGGGGGGAGGEGGDRAAPHGGHGGIGLPSSITGTEVYRAGGGGGGDGTGSITTGGTGGLGGGGHGNGPLSAGTANTGGGGGAGGWNSGQTGAAGGSGVVIVRYKFNAMLNGPRTIQAGSTSTYTYFDPALADGTTVDYALSNITDQELVDLTASGTLTMSSTVALLPIKVSNAVTESRTITLTLTLPDSSNVFQDIIVVPQLKVVSSSTFNIGEWNHFAVTRDTNDFKLFINGSQAGSTATVAYDFGTATINLVAGADIVADELYLEGRMSDVRVVTGSALYNDAFTVPNARLTATNETKLLTFSKSVENSTFFKDASSANHTITAYNGAYNVFDSPYTRTPYEKDQGYGSIYFEGNGDYLSIPNSTELILAGSPWTIEFWVNPNADYSAYRTIIAKRIPSSGTTSYEIFLHLTNGTLGYYNGTQYNSTTVLPTNQWSHVAFTHDGNTELKFYVNGVNVYTGSTSVTEVDTPLIIGGSVGYSEYFSGYLADLRITKGSVLYTDTFTPPLSPLETTAETVLLLRGDNADVYDDAAHLDVGLINGASIDTIEVDQKPFSINCTGAGYMVISPPTRINMAGTDQYRFEFNFKNESITNDTGIATYGWGGYAPWLFYVNGTNLLFYSSSNNSSWDISSAVTLIPMLVNTWYNIKLDRDSAGYKIYINDELKYTVARSSAFFTPPADRNYITIGADVTGGRPSSIYVEGVRIYNTVDPLPEYQIGLKDISNLSTSRTDVFQPKANAYETPDGNPNSVTYFAGRSVPIISYQTTSSLQYIVGNDGSVIIADITDQDDPTLDRNPVPAGTVVVGAATPKRIWF